jgi:hypothetical protein
MRKINIVRTLVLGVFSVPMMGCFGMIPGWTRTPMPPNQVEDLTTCKNTDLGKIKKNLMLNGYSIRDADQDAVETEFKQIAGYGNSKVSERISAIKVDDSTVKFRVRVREDSLNRVETGQLRSSTGQVIATDSKLVHNENEQDEHYYAETIEQHQTTKRQVCGS